jgi:hypothetical protein
VTTIIKRKYRKIIIHYFFLFVFLLYGILNSYYWISCIESGFRKCVNFSPFGLFILPFEKMYGLFFEYSENEILHEYALIEIFVTMIAGILFAKFINYIIDKMTICNNKNHI